MSLEASEDPLDLAWRSLLTAWDDDARHKSFVALAQSLGRLPDAAARYRGVRDDKALGANAQRGIDQILKVAMLTLTPPPREARPPKGAWAAAVAFAMLLIVATLLLSHLTQVRALASPWVVLVEMVIAAVIPWSRLMRRED
ncbi:MAG: hypothetical protein R3A52_13410 [Polyangiales bacterium]